MEIKLKLGLSVKCLRFPTGKVSLYLFTQKGRQAPKLA